MEYVLGTGRSLGSPAHDFVGWCKIDCKEMTVGSREHQCCVAPENDFADDNREWRLMEGGFSSRQMLTMKSEAEQGKEPLNLADGTSDGKGESWGVGVLTLGGW